MNSNAALLIIDVQVGAFDGEIIKRIPDAEKFIEKIHSIITKSRKKGLPIIYVQDCGKVGGAFEKGTKHWEIHPGIKPIDGDDVIYKHTSDAFDQTNLNEVLQNMNIKKLVVCGLHSDGCVKETILSGLRRGFEIAVVADAHSTNKENNQELVMELNAFFKINGARLDDNSGDG